VDLTELVPNIDRLLSHKAHHHRNHIRQAITDFTQAQWVIVDHLGELDPNLANLSNVVTDSLQAVLALAPD
jgi:phosphatidate phosphatase APP1